MALEDLESELRSRVDIDPLGTEADPDGAREYFVAEIPESEVDEAASIAERRGFGDITFEPGRRGREVVRFSRDR